VRGRLRRQQPAFDRQRVDGLMIATNASLLKVMVRARRAREIGVELPKSLLVRADEVIE
jgi:hypothetical protein